MIGAGEGYNVDGNRLLGVVRSGEAVFYSFDHVDDPLGECKNRSNLNVVDGNADGKLEAGIDIISTYPDRDIWSTEDFDVEQVNFQIALFNEQLPTTLKKAATRLAKSGEDFLSATGVSRTRAWTTPEGENHYFYYIAAVDDHNDGNYDNVVIYSKEDKLLITLLSGDEFLSYFNDDQTALSKTKESRFDPVVLGLAMWGAQG